MSDRLAQLTKFYDLDPNDTFTTYAIAMEYKKTGAPADALEWINKTLEIDGNYAYAWYQKAAILLEMRKQDDAHQAMYSGMEAAKASNDGQALSELKDLIVKTGGKL